MENTNPVEKTASKKAQLRRSGNFRLPKPFEEEDAKYANFLKKIDGFEYTGKQEYKLLDNPLIILEKAAEETDTEIISSELPLGNYADLQEGSPFAVRKFKNESNYVLPKQGWKIHIPALPHSAQKIASLVMAVIDKDIALANLPESNTNYKHTFFKIIETIPFMRSTYYIVGNLRGDGRETQIGKFITIYPANKKHARAIAARIDDLFYFAKLGDILKDQDFYPLSGEAELGQTGWVYIRYGNMTSTFDQINYKKYMPARAKEIEVIKKKNKSKNNNNSKEADVSEISILETDRSVFVQDDRFHPWPDFMNKNEESWRDARDPFPDLNMRWRPNPQTDYIYWHSRPNTWGDLK